MNPATECPGCCSCPPPEILVAHRSATASLCGYIHECEGDVYGPFKTVTARLENIDPCPPYEFDGQCTPNGINFRPTWGAGGSAQIGTFTLERNSEGVCDADYSDWTSVLTGPCQRYFYEYSNVAPESEIYDVLAAALAAATFSGFVSSNASAERAHSYDRGILFFVATMQFKYKLRFTRPTSRNRSCYRLSWLERFVPALTRDVENNITGGGASLDSVEVTARGSHRPIVTVGARVVYDEELGDYVGVGTDGGGTGLKIIPVMAANGSVASLRIVNRGSGYTEAPSIWFEGYGNAEAEGTVTIDADPESPTFGRVMTATVTNAGDYLPLISFNAPNIGGSQAEATAVMDEQGGISSINVSAAGSRYYPFITSGYGLDLGNGTSVVLHYGEETPFCYKWTGDGEDVIELPERTSPELSAPGYFMAEVTGYACDCSNCP